MKVQELIDKLTNEYCEHGIYSIWDAEECMSKDVCVVARDLNPDKYRYYIRSTSVYKCDDGFVGVRTASTKFTENCYWEDLDAEFEVFPMKEVIVKSYEKI